MISNIARLFFICTLFVVCSNISLAQNNLIKPYRQKVVIEGKTYFTHKVQRSEGLFHISQVYGVSQKRIIDANPNIINGLKVGEIINIPVNTSPQNTNIERSHEDNFIYHTVVKGQTLYFLSNKYKVSINSIINNNPGSEKGLEEGATIKIPIKKKVEYTNNGEYTYYTVKHKETIYSISKRYNTTVNTLLVLNPALKNGTLNINSRIRVPIIKKEDVLDKTKNNSNIEDENFIYYHVGQNEELNSICTRYSINKEKLKQANEGVDIQNIQEGYLLRIPKNIIKKDKLRRGYDFILHRVRKKQTLYSIASKYGVSVDDIKDINNSDLTSLKKGDKIKIPTLDYLIRKKDAEKQIIEVATLAKAKQDSINEENGVASLATQTKNCLGEYYTHPADETITVAILLPFNIKASEDANVIKKIVDGKEITVQREDSIISPKSKTFVEFYEGALMALDSLKNQGLKIKLLTYDTAPNANRVRQILAKEEMQSVDLIIGPAYASNLHLVSQFSINHHIHMIYPLSSLKIGAEQNPFLFQVNSPDNLLDEQYANYIANKSDSVRLIVVNSKYPKSDELKLTHLIKQKVYARAISNGYKADFMQVSFYSKNIKGVAALMSSEKKNIVIVPSSNEADVSKIVTVLKGVKETTDHDVNLIGFNKWLRFQTITPQDIYELNTEILTTHAFDYSKQSTQDYIRKYRNWYHTEPYAIAPKFVRSSSNVNYSRYGTFGFDITYYFVSARSLYGPNFEYCLGDYKAEQIQFNFNFKKSENWGGFYNSGLLVLKFSPDYSVKTTKLQ